MLNNEEIERALYWNSLCNLGDYAKLKLSIDSNSVISKIEEFKDKWVPYNQKKDTVNNRWGLPITSYDGDVESNFHLNSFGYMQKYHDVSMKEENFRTPTVVYHKVPEIAQLVDLFSPDIGRVHLIRVDKGGFFPPHRDFPGVSPEYFRLVALFGNCSEFNYSFQLNDQLFRPDGSFLYFVNFQLNHSIFSFSDGLYALILTVKLNERTHELILKNSASE